jgi:hypothetical protein
VSHILFENFGQVGVSSGLDTMLRRSSGRLGLKGAVVGVSTNANVVSQRVVSAKKEEVEICVVALQGQYGTIEDPEYRGRLSDQTGSRSLLVWVGRRLEHEAMLEVMALSVEVRAKIAMRGGRQDESSALRRNLEGPEPVAVASYEDGEARFRGNKEHLIALIGQALTDCLHD